MTSLPPLIALEEHFFSSQTIAAINSPTQSTQSAYAQQIKNLPGVLDSLADLSSRRLKHMDGGKVSLQVISHAAGELDLGGCVVANDELGDAIENNDRGANGLENKGRMAGFATLPVSKPEECALELERCVCEKGFVGALIDNHTSSGVYYDGAEYDILWRKAQELVVPVYLHPTWATPEVRDVLYTGNFPEGASQSLAASSFGWHSDVALHVLRLFASGTFDKFPRLKLIIGHFGEMLPFMLGRIEQLSPRWGESERKFKDVWNENIWITTSGVWSVDPMAMMLRNTRVERILYSVDYPFANCEQGLEWVRELERSGLVGREGLERICFRNAEALLGVKVGKSFE